MRNRMLALIGPLAVAAAALWLAPQPLAARGESPTAFGRRCIPSPPQRAGARWGPRPGCVAPPSNIPDIATPPRKPRAAGAPVLGRHALPAGVPGAAAALGWSTGRIAGLGATPDFHHGLLCAQPVRLPVLHAHLDLLARR